MPVLRPRGFTLVEVIVSLGLLALVAAGLWRVLDTTRQAYLVQTQRVDLQRTLRESFAVLPAELRELDAADSDIAAMSETSIRIRASRQLAFLCAAPQRLDDGAVTLTVRREPFFGMSQSFSPGDSVLLYDEGDPATPRDDLWLRGEVLAVSNEDCPDADRPRPGYRVTLRFAWSDGAPDVRGVTTGAPLRGFASVAYALYRSPADTQWYIGQQVQDGTPQPLIGPLTGPAGVTFIYYDSAGAPTSSRAAVAEIEIRVRGRTARPLRTASARATGYESDSLVTRVALRNGGRASPSP